MRFVQVENAKITLDKIRNTDPPLPNQPTPCYSVNTSFGQRLNTRQLSWRPLELEPFQFSLANS